MNLTHAHFYAERDNEMAADKHPPNCPCFGCVDDRKKNAPPIPLDALFWPSFPLMGFVFAQHKERKDHFFITHADNSLNLYKADLSTKSWRFIQQTFASPTKG